MREFLIFGRHLLHILRYVRGVMLVLLAALLTCAVLVAQVENMGFGDALYFTLITGLTVGYGDIAPATTTGRVVSIVAGVIGVVYVGIIVAVATRALRDAVHQDRGIRDESRNDAEGH
ncbi:MAG: potassium channel family protein [Rhodospirillales bacterium]|nr:potassium channel family protein [Rhodospirillales bacterium]MDH3790903.1 potassium channel family protein [Rhodospirillales bacterium]MDH3911264.1 potassium channel family protein [Rhodospirillales bacterium]MDH3966572.1 potassium channel family protein [Rhodospirillales bacterium]